MKIKIIEEGENIHHLIVGDKDIWLTSEEVTDLAYRLKLYSQEKQLNHW